MTTPVTEIVGGEPYQYYPLGDYVVRAVGVCGGRPTFKYTRIEITGTLERLAAGESVDAIVKGYRGRVSRAAIMEAVRLVTAEFLKQKERASSEEKQANITQEQIAAGEEERFHEGARDRRKRLGRLGFGSLSYDRRPPCHPSGTVTAAPRCRRGSLGPGDRGPGPRQSRRDGRGCPSGGREYRRRALDG